MLDAFKKGASTRQQQTDELQTLIAASKEERAALSTMLTQVQQQTAKLASAGKSLQEVEEKADKAQARLDEVSDQDLARVSPHLTPDVRAVLTVDGALAARKGFGGTAPDRVAEQLVALRATVNDAAAWATAGGA